MSYNVRFVCIPSVEGVKCTLDGVVKYSVNGFANFYNISAGDHSYSVEPPEGMKFVSGEDSFKRPLSESGITTIEWPGAPIPWPTDQPWLVNFIFEEIITPSPGEFIFAAYTPLLDTREIFPVGAPWPSVTKTYQVGDSVYVHYAVKNIARVGVGSGIITVRDLDTGAVITTWAVPELRPNERFKTSGSGAYVGKMPSKDWRIEFKVEP